MIKKLCAFLILFIMLCSTALAQNIKFKANIADEFSTENVPEHIQFKINNELSITDDIIIPSESVIKGEVYQYQKERRWHKAGFFIFIPKEYYNEKTNENIILELENTYFIARKHENLNKKEAAITAIEILGSTAVSYFAPGVDIAYFFTKGAIQRKKHPNWFKAGVSNAYDNSICWLWLKGKPIELVSGDMIQIKELKEKKAKKIKVNVDKKRKKANIKAEKKAVKRKIKADKKQAKQQLKDEKRQLKQQKKQEKIKLEEEIEIDYDEFEIENDI